MTWGKATDAQLLEAIQASYVSLGILPFPQKSATYKVTKKSNEVSSQYSVRRYVDVKSWNPFGWNLAGNGLSYDICGHIYYDEGKGCLNVEGHTDKQIYVRLIAQTCFRLECPVCYQKACARQAGRITQKFERLPKVNGIRDPTAEDPVPGLGRPIHLIVSVPEDESNLIDGRIMSSYGGKFHFKQNYSMLRARAYKMAKKAGFKGGCVIFHPFSNDKLGEDDTAESVYPKLSDNSCGVDLKWLKEYFTKNGGHVGLWYYRPHFHFIGYGWIEHTDQIYEETGWVVVNLGVRKSVYNTALYQLSHCGIKKGVQTISWMGVMANGVYHKLNPAPKPPRNKPTCPECGCYLAPVRWDGEGESPLFGELEGGYWIDPGGYRYLDPDEKNHSCLVVRPKTVVGGR